MTYQDYQKNLSSSMQKYIKDAFSFYEYLRIMNFKLRTNEERIKYALLLSGIYNKNLLANRTFLDSDCQNIYHFLEINPNLIKNYVYNEEILFYLFQEYLEKFTNNLKLTKDESYIELILYNLIQDEKINYTLAKVLDNNNYHIIKMNLVDAFWKIKMNINQEYLNSLSGEKQNFIYLASTYLQYFENNKKNIHYKEECALFLAGISLVKEIPMIEKNIIYEHFEIKGLVSSVPYSYIQKKVDKFRKIIENLENDVEYSEEFLNQNEILIILSKLINKISSAIKAELNSMLPDNYLNKLNTHLNEIMLKKSDEKETVVVKKEIKRNNITLINKKNRGKILNEFGFWLTDQKYDNFNLIGRREALDELETYLIKRNKSVIILGESGVGKTALVKGVAKDIVEGKVSNILKEKEIVQIDLTSLLGGMRYRGDFEERISNLIKELKVYPNAILYFEEMHRINGLGDNDRNNDLMNILKSTLASGQIKIIGDTTTNEFDKYLGSDEAFRRRFELVYLQEPNREILKNILFSAVDELENYYSISFEFNLEDKNIIFDYLIDLTDSKKQAYYSTRRNPDFVLDLLDTIFAVAINRNHEKIMFEDIIYCMKKCQDVSESYKNRIVNDLQKKFKILKQEDKGRVIKFPSSYSLKS